MSDQQPQGFTPRNQEVSKWATLHELVAEEAEANKWYRLQSIGILLMGIGAILCGLALIYCCAFPSPAGL